LSNVIIVSTRIQLSSFNLQVFCPQCGSPEAGHLQEEGSMTGQTTAEQGISKEAAGNSYGEAALGLGLTRQLADHVDYTRFSDRPANIVAAARRGIIDWLGCAIAGSGQPGPGIVYRTLSAAAPGKAVAIGRSSGLAPRDAALFNGTAGHVLDFDDTHMGG